MTYLLYRYLRRFYYFSRMIILLAIHHSMSPYACISKYTYISSKYLLVPHLAARPSLSVLAGLFYFCSDHHAIATHIRDTMLPPPPPLEQQQSALRAVPPLFELVAPRGSVELSETGLLVGEGFALRRTATAKASTGDGGCSSGSGGGGGGGGGMVVGSGDEAVTAAAVATVFANAEDAESGDGDEFDNATQDGDDDSVGAGDASGGGTDLSFRKRLPEENGIGSGYQQGGAPPPSERESSNSNLLSKSRSTAQRTSFNLTQLGCCMLFAPILHRCRRRRLVVVLSVWCAYRARPCCRAHVAASVADALATDDNDGGVRRLNKCFQRTPALRTHPFLKVASLCSLTVVRLCRKLVICKLQARRRQRREPPRLLDLCFQLV